MNLIEIMKEEKFKHHLKKHYHKLCKKLNIDKHYEKKINDKYWFKLYDIHMSPITNIKEFENRISFLYIKVLFEDLRLVQEVYYKDTYLTDYMNNHSVEIELLEKLLSNKNHKYNNLLFKKTLILKDALNKLFKKLDIVANYDINEKINPEKDAETLKIKKEIYKYFDSFFESVNLLNDICKKNKVTL